MKTPNTLRTTGRTQISSKKESELTKQQLTWETHEEVMGNRWKQSLKQDKDK